MNRIKSYLANEFYKRQYELAKWRYEKARAGNNFLPDHRFESFVRKYGSIEAKPFQDYSLPALRDRGKKKAEALRPLVQTDHPSVLEIGAADGFALKELLLQGAKRAVAVDIGDHLHPEVKMFGVELNLGSAEEMVGLTSGSFDLIYSWGSFEHIRDIKKTTSECMRLLRPGGAVYIEAGPLYYSPWGYHYYSILRVPYIHLLFSKEILQDYAKAKRGKEAKNYVPWTSGNPSAKYFELVQNLPDDIQVDNFWHGYDWFASDMIIKYPEIFKSKPIPFDDFFIDCVKITLRKKS